MMTSLTLSLWRQTFMLLRSVQYGFCNIRILGGFQLFILYIILSFFYAPFLIAQDFTSQAESLVKQAEALGRRGEVIVIGEKGLTIDGTSLSGAEVQRPDMLYSRAAELYADSAMQSSDVGVWQKAFKIWYSIGDFSTPVAYMRLLSSRSSPSDDIHAFADVELAKCYLRQGDATSAIRILTRYTTLDPKNEYIGQAKALYARFLLGQGKFDEARQLAEEVKTKLLHSQMVHDSREDSEDIAVSVLASLPTANKQGQVSGSAKEGELLADVQANPRRYYALGDTALAAGNKAKAIEYWLEYSKRYPQEETARLVVNRIAKLYAELGNTAGALDTYKQSWISYPDFREGWQARLEASKLMEKAGTWQEALKILDEGQTKTQTAEGQAWMIARQAEIYAKNKNPDLAVEKYILLLSKYGDQDAARNAYKQLSGLAGQTKDWKKITNLIRDWLSSGANKSGSLGNVNLTMGARSELRRLGLNFYVEQGETQSGLSWLKSIGFSSEQIERDWVVRDEAWFYAGIAKQAVKKGKQVPAKDFTEALQLGLRAWQIAPSTEEGISGLRAAYDLSISPIAKKNQVKDVIAQVEALKGTEYDDVAKDMLATLYKITGDKKGLEELNN